MKTLLLSLLLGCLLIGTAQAADALDVLNWKRRQVGLYPLIHDPKLSALAEAKCKARAKRGLTGHLGGEIGRAEGTGWNSRNDPKGLHFKTCYWHTRRYRYAGVSAVVGRRGTFYELNLR